MNANGGGLSARVLLVGRGPAVDEVGAALGARGDVTAERAHDGIGALGAVEAREFDCAVVAPGVGRPGFVERLRRAGVRGPVVALRGDRERGDAGEAPSAPEGTDGAGRPGGDAVAPGGDAGVQAADAVAPLAEPALAADVIAARAVDGRVDAATSARRRARAAVSRTRAALRDAEDRAALERTLVDGLSGAYRSAWVGRREVDGGRVEPVESTDVDPAHLGGVDAAAPPAAGALAGEVTASVDGGDSGRGAGERGPEAAGRGGDAGAGPAGPTRATVPTTVAVPLGGDPPGLLFVRADRPPGPDERAALSALGAAASDRFADLDAGGDRLSVLAGALGHELANHLDAASAHLELARERPDPGPHFDRVDRALERLDRLADDARALARGEPDRAACDLAAAAEAAWATVGDDRAELTARSGTVEADPDLLGLALENLLRNAVEHGRADGADSSADDPSDGDRPDADREASTVRVAVGPLDGGGFYVEDDGPGVPEAERERILEWGRSPAGGTGVGLGVVSLVAERHGWSVTVGESERSGARFALGPV